MNEHTDTPALKVTKRELDLLRPDGTRLVAHVAIDTATRRLVSVQFGEEEEVVTEWVSFRHRLRAGGRK